MRWPEAKLKEARVHPQQLARREAVPHFADCSSRDAEVGPLENKRVELAHLAQSDARVEWGNQQGQAFLAEAFCCGTLADLLRSFFP